MNAYQEREHQALRALVQRHPSLAKDAVELLQLFEAGWQSIARHGDVKRWNHALHDLPDVSPASWDVQCDVVRLGSASELSTEQKEHLQEGLGGLRPWRKGPFDVFGVHIDTEWHSDWKWQRVQPHISPLRGRTVLDVGCGSGYHMWRMLGDGAACVLGIDPSALFSFHFAVLKRYLPELPVFLLPVGIDAMPERMHSFDSVFSMGVLYHRASPIEHIMQLKACLKPDGELILETLVVDGDATTCLMPRGRYAKMRNVWFIPSVAMLEVWLMRCGFHDIRCVDVAATTIEEQRSTPWMPFESLVDFLDVDDSSQTIEGYPAPKRATLVASRGHGQ